MQALSPPNLFVIRVIRVVFTKATTPSIFAPGTFTRVPTLKGGEERAAQTKT